MFRGIGDVEGVSYLDRANKLIASIFCHIVSLLVHMMK